MDAKLIQNIVIFIAIYAVLRLVMGGRVDRSADVPSLLAAGAKLIDVRTPGEFSRHHAEGAINVPLNTLPGGLDKKIKKNQPIILYCQSGSRSGMAKKILQKAGYEEVINAGSLHRVSQILKK